jgi:hypothetical protein
MWEGLLQILSENPTFKWVAITFLVLTVPAHFIKRYEQHRVQNADQGWQEMPNALGLFRLGAILAQIGMLLLNWKAALIIIGFVFLLAVFPLTSLVMETIGQVMLIPIKLAFHKSWRELKDPPTA